MHLGLIWMEYFTLIIQIIITYKKQNVYTVYFI